MGLAGKLWGAEVCHWGAGTRPGARHVRGMKWSQTRWVAGRTSERANGSGWLGRRVGDGWWEGGRTGGRGGRTGEGCWLE